MPSSYLPRCGEYALRAMAFLAAGQGRTAIAREIAEATQVPLNYLQKILSQLARSGLLRAQRGLGGGFTLSRDPREISMHEIFRAVDAQVERITRCPLGVPGHTTLCPMHRRLDQTYEMIDVVFRTTSLASLVEASPLAGGGGQTPLCGRCEVAFEAGRECGGGTEAVEDPDAAGGEIAGRG